MTLLHRAARASRLTVADTLLQAGADVNFQGERGISPLHEASRAGSPRVVSLLLRRGASVEAKDSRGRTALHYAGNCEVARILLSAGAVADVKDSSGKRPYRTAGTEEACAAIKRSARTKGCRRQRLKIDPDTARSGTSRNNIDCARSSADSDSIGAGHAGRRHINTCPSATKHGAFGDDIKTRHRASSSVERAVEITHLEIEALSTSLSAVQKNANQDSVDTLQGTCRRSDDLSSWLKHHVAANYGARSGKKNIAPVLQGSDGHGWPSLVGTGYDDRRATSRSSSSSTARPAGSDARPLLSRHTCCNRCCSGDGVSNVSMGKVYEKTEPRPRAKTGWPGEVKAGDVHEGGTGGGHTVTGETVIWEESELPFSKRDWFQGCRDLDNPDSGTSGGPSPRGDSGYARARNTKMHAFVDEKALPPTARQRFIERRTQTAFPGIEETPQAMDADADGVEWGIAHRLVASVTRSVSNNTDDGQVSGSLDRRRRRRRSRERSDAVTGKDRREPNRVFHAAVMEGAIGERDEESPSADSSTEQMIACALVRSLRAAMSSVNSRFARGGSSAGGTPRRSGEENPTGDCSREHANKRRNPEFDEQHFDKGLVDGAGRERNHVPSSRVRGTMGINARHLDDAIREAMMSTSHSRISSGNRRERAEKSQQRSTNGAINRRNPRRAPSWSSRNDPEFVGRVEGADGAMPLGFHRGAELTDARHPDGFLNGCYTGAAAMANSSSMMMSGVPSGRRQVELGPHTDEASRETRERFAQCRIPSTVGDTAESEQVHGEALGVAFCRFDPCANKPHGAETKRHGSKEEVLDAGRVGDASVEPLSDGVAIQGDVQTNDTDKAMRRGTHDHEKRWNLKPNRGMTGVEGDKHEDSGSELPSAEGGRSKQDLVDEDLVIAEKLLCAVRAAVRNEEPRSPGKQAPHFPAAHQRDLAIKTVHVSINISAVGAPEVTTAIDTPSVQSLRSTSEHENSSGCASHFDEIAARSATYLDLAYSSMDSTATHRSRAFLSTTHDRPERGDHTPQHPTTAVAHSRSQLPRGPMRTSTPRGNLPATASPPSSHSDGPESAVCPANALVVPVLPDNAMVADDGSLDGGGRSTVPTGRGIFSKRCAESEAERGLLAAGASSSQAVEPTGKYAGEAAQHLRGVQHVLEGESVCGGCYTHMSTGTKEAVAKSTHTPMLTSQAELTKKPGAENVPKSTGSMQDENRRCTSSSQHDQAPDGVLNTINAFVSPTTTLPLSLDDVHSVTGGHTKLSKNENNVVSNGGVVFLGRRETSATAEAVRDADACGEDIEDSRGGQELQGAIKSSRRCAHVLERAGTGCLKDLTRIATFPDSPTSQSPVAFSPRIEVAGGDEIFASKGEEDDAKEIAGAEGSHSDVCFAEQSGTFYGVRRAVRLPRTTGAAKGACEVAVPTAETPATPATPKVAGRKGAAEGRTWDTKGEQDCEVFTRTEDASVKLPTCAGEHSLETCTATAADGFHATLRCSPAARASSSNTKVPGRVMTASTGNEVVGEEEEDTSGDYAGAQCAPRYIGHATTESCEPTEDVQLPPRKTLMAAAMEWEAFAKKDPGCWESAEQHPACASNNMEGGSVVEMSGQKATQSAPRRAVSPLSDRNAEQETSAPYPALAFRSHDTSEGSNDAHAKTPGGDNSIFACKTNNSEKRITGRISTERGTKPASDRSVSSVFVAVPTRSVTKAGDSFSKTASFRTSGDVARQLDDVTERLSRLFPGPTSGLRGTEERAAWRVETGRVIAGDG